MTALWADIQDEIQRQLATVGARVYKAGAASGGRRKLRLDPASTDDSGELYALLKGLPKIAAGDDVAVITLGGKRFILGPVQNTAQTAITYDLPIIGEQGFNSPFSETPTISNSAAVSSTTDTANYSINVQNTSFDLPTGTWTVHAWGGGFYAHSSDNGQVRAHLQVGNDAGTALVVACRQNTGRTYIGLANAATGQTGSIEIRQEYRPQSSGTAYAGGGWLFGLAYRTA